MPGDEVQSLPMCSTAPVEGKARVSHEKRGMVHGADLGGFTVEQAKMLMNPVDAGHERVRGRGSWHVPESIGGTRI